MTCSIPEVVQQRFWLKVAKSDGCWEWQGTRQEHGYGSLRHGKNRKWYAHRVSFAIANGDIPKGMSVCHRCDNPSCVRPDHLFLGTHAENLADAAAKLRFPARSSLTPRDIPYVRELNGIGFSQRELAKMYGVAQATVGAIIRREIWKHVP